MYMASLHIVSVENETVELNYLNKINASYTLAVFVHDTFWYMDTCRMMHQNYRYSLLSVHHREAIIGPMNILTSDTAKYFLPDVTSRWPLKRKNNIRPLPACLSLPMRDRWRVWCLFVILTVSQRHRAQLNFPGDLWTSGSHMGRQDSHVWVDKLSCVPIENVKITSMENVSTRVLYENKEHYMKTVFPGIWFPW